MKSVLTLNYRAINKLYAVKRRSVSSGCKSRAAHWTFQPVAIGAAVEVSTSAENWFFRTFGGAVRLACEAAI